MSAPRTKRRRTRRIGEEEKEVLDDEQNSLREDFIAMQRQLREVQEQLLIANTQFQAVQKRLLVAERRAHEEIFALKQGLCASRRQKKALEQSVTWERSERRRLQRRVSDLEARLGGDSAATQLLVERATTSGFDYGEDDETVDLSSSASEGEGGATVPLAHNITTSDMSLDSARSEGGGAGGGDGMPEASRADLLARSREGLARSATPPLPEAEEAALEDGVQQAAANTL